MLARVILLLITIMLSALACAMTQVTFTTGDLLDNADHVVLARLQHAEFNQAPGSVLKGSTGYFHFVVEETIKGDPPLRAGELVLRLGAVAPSSAPFNVGERVVLFLGRTNQEGYPTLYGSQQTVLHVVESTRAFPHPALQGEKAWVIKNGVTGMAGAPDDPAAARRVTLAEFLAAARARVTAAKEPPP